MKLVEVDVDVVVDMAVAARAVDLVRVFSIMRIFLLVRVPLRTEILGNRWTGVGMVGVVVLSEVVVVENLVMGKLVMENVLAGHMNTVVELGVGEYFFSNVHAYRQFTFVGYTLLGVKSEFSDVQK